MRRKMGFGVYFDADGDMDLVLSEGVLEREKWNLDEDEHENLVL